MSRTIVEIPELQLGVLQRGYDAALSARRRQTAIGAAVLLVAILVAGFVGEVDAGKLFANIHRLPDYIGRIFTVDDGRPVWADPLEWMWGADIWLKLLGETLLIAYPGTVTGALLGFVLCLAANANLARSTWIRGGAWRMLEICRTVPELVFALVFVQAFGPGPLSGVLAIAIHTVGALGKLFAEVVEKIDMKPVEGVTACGGTWIESIRYGLFPQAVSVVISQVLHYFGSNTRSATIIGIVGAGGIGLHLAEQIRVLEFQHVSTVVLMILAVVAVIDLVCTRLRLALIGRNERPA